MIFICGSDAHNTYICLSPVTQAKHFDTCGLILVFASIHVISKLINIRWAWRLVP